MKLIINDATTLKSSFPIREHKGKSFIALPLDYTILDIETTGLDFEYCEIIEVGALKIRGGEVVDRFSSLVRPQNQIDDFITDLTGITNECWKVPLHFRKSARIFITLFRMMFW